MGPLSSRPIHWYFVNWLRRRWLNHLHSLDPMSPSDSGLTHGPGRNQAHPNAGPSLWISKEKRKGKKSRTVGQNPNLHSNQRSDLTITVTISFRSWLPGKKKERNNRAKLEKKKKKNPILILLNNGNFSSFFSFFFSFLDLMLSGTWNSDFSFPTNCGRSDSYCCRTGRERLD